LRGAAFNKDNKLRVGFSKLVEISENPENIRVRYNISRSVSQASASCDGSFLSYFRLTAPKSNKKS
jgi:hypothetical protein